MDCHDFATLPLAKSRNDEEFGGNGLMEYFAYAVSLGALFAVMFALSYAAYKNNQSPAK